MQRRAAAVYFIVFSALAIGALGFMEVGATQPEVELDGQTYSQGDTLTVGDRTYTVTAVEAEVEEGEHGAPDEVVRSGELTWFNESQTESAQLENDSTTQFRDDEYRVFIENDTNVTEFTVTEERDVAAIIENDSDVEERVTNDDGEEYVRYTNGSTQLLSAYLGPADNETFAEGDEFPYQLENETVDANVTAVDPAAVTLTWDSPGNETIGLEEGANITLNGQQHFAHFPDNNTVKILPNDEYYDSYQTELSNIDEFKTRMNGLWGIVFLSLMGGIILMAAAYLPNKG